MFNPGQFFTDVNNGSQIRPNPGFLTAEQWVALFRERAFRARNCGPDMSVSANLPAFFTGAICGQSTDAE